MVYFFPTMFFSSVHLADSTFLLDTLNHQGPCSFCFPGSYVSLVSDQLIDTEISCMQFSVGGLGFFDVAPTTSLGRTFHF